MQRKSSLQRLGLGAAAAAVASLLALGTLAGTAAATPNILALKLEVAGKELAGGARLTIATTDLTLANSFWSMTCTEGTMEAKVGQNGHTKNNFDPITSGVFGGGSPNGNGLCESPYEFVTSYEPEETSELVLNRPPHGGREGEGQALWRFPRFKLIPLADVENPGGHKETCDITSNQLAGTFPVNDETPQPLVVTFTGARMHLKGDHGTECGSGKGASPLLSTTLTLTSDGSQVEAVLYDHR